MRQGAKKGDWSWVGVISRVGKTILIGVVVTATAGAAGSLSLNICPACGTNLRPQEYDKQPEPEANTVKPNVILPGDVSPMPKGVQRTP
jgi:hypothetical protein